MQRREQLERLLNWAWDQYDWLSDWQRVGLGVAATLLLASSSMYCLGAASLVALSRQPASASAEPAATATAEVALQPVATEVNPISPLLADRTPTLRPSATPTVPGGTVAPGTRTATPAAGSLPRRGSPAALVTATRTPTALAVPRASTPTGGATNRDAAGPTSPALPWGTAPSPSPARPTGGTLVTATPTRPPLR